QDHNLRTYLPRPLPNAEEWQALRARLAEALNRPEDYQGLIRSLRQARGQPEIERALESYLRDDRPFAQCLAHRLIDQPSDRLAALACRHAARCLKRDHATPTAWALAAALLA